jgi:hypothetical protein
MASFFRPTPVRGSTKYGSKGGCAADLLRELHLPAETATALSALGNMGIAQSTWSTYKTAKTMIEKCQADVKVDLSVPFDQRKTLIFIDWLVRVRKLKASTVNSYLAGVRQLHTIVGAEPPNLRTSLVKLVLKGLSNRDGIHSRSKDKVGRLPMTMNMMLVLKNTISNSDFNKRDKKLLWAVSTIAFAGAFRIGEILSKHEATFDPDFTLLTRDVTWSLDSNDSTVIHVSLKCPKETKSVAPTVVDLYQNNGPLCPVKAFLTWFKLKPREAECPMFRWENGTPLTGTKLNAIMSKLLGPYTDRNKGSFNTHSFRIGLASMLGTLGYSDEEVQASGRWSSRAFETYMKLKRTKRAALGKQIRNITL